MAATLTMLLWFCVVVIPLYFIATSFGFTSNLHLSYPELFVYFSFLCFSLFFVFKRPYRFFLKLTSDRPKEKWDYDSERISNLKDFVIVLRPFKMDRKLDRYDYSGFNPFNLVPTKLFTIEEQLTFAFKEAGLEVVGFAHPDKHSVYLGYRRFLVDHDQWQPLVLELIKNCTFICCFGNEWENRGFQWELEHIFSKEQRSKVLIYYPGEKSRFSAFLNCFNKYMLFDENVFYKHCPRNGEVFGGILYTVNSQGFAFYSFKKLFNSANKRLTVWAGTKEFLANIKQLPDLILRPVKFTYGLYATLIDILLLVIGFLFIDLFPLPHPASIAIFLGLMLIFLLRGISLGKLVLGIKVRDKSGCPGQAGQILVRQYLRLLTIVLFAGYLVFVLIYYLVKKKIYLMHEELSLTRKFRVVTH